MPFLVPDDGELHDDLEAMEHAAMLNDASQGETLGRKLMAAAATWIKATSDAQTSPDGWPWPDLGETYKPMKMQAVGFIYPMGVFENKMLQTDQIEGEQVIGEHDAYQTYGLDARNKAVAVRFQEGQAATGLPNHQPRPFYAFSVSAFRQLDYVVEQHFAGITF